MDLTTIITSGIVAALATTVLTFFKEQHFANKENSRKTKMLAIKLAYELETFAMDCAIKIADNKEYDERISSCNGPIKSHCDFGLLNISVVETDWADLELFYVADIIKLKQKITFLQENINNEIVMCDPYYGMLELIKSATEVGRESWELAAKIKVAYKIPQLDLDEMNYNPIKTYLLH